MKSSLFTFFRSVVCGFYLCALGPAADALTPEDGGKLYDIIPASGRQEINPSNDTRKAIIVVHGWNPDEWKQNGLNRNLEFAGADGFYASQSLASLVTNLRARLSRPDNTDWKLILYHWERDAATGPAEWAPLIKLPAATNGTEAAQAGYAHGAALADKLSSTAPNLEKVHFIAHSAGTWVVYRAVNELRILMPNVRVHVTLLDPFIPGSLWAFVIAPSYMHVNDIERLNSLPNVVQLENYYSSDIVLGTQETFAWGGDTHQS